MKHSCEINFVSETDLARVLTKLAELVLTDKKIAHNPSERSEIGDSSAKRREEKFSGDLMFGKDVLIRLLSVERSLCNRRLRPKPTFDIEHTVG